MLIRTLLVLLILMPLAVVWAQAPAISTSSKLKKDMDLDADPNSKLWKGVKGVFADHSARGELSPGHKTEIRSRWTKDYLYFLFVCPYKQLYLKPDPDTVNETNRLWNWDVAELFVGADFENIHQYREYQVSPHGEWVDLDIDRKQPKPEGGWLWNSGFKVAARIDEANKVWYGAMKIPMKSITDKPVKEGVEFRANYYRIQGPPPKKVFVAWQATGGNHHIPEKFGLLKLVK
jgi:hypothetical protein